MEVKELDLSKIDWRKAAKWACAAAALALVIMLCINLSLIHISHVSAYSIHSFLFES